MKPRACALLLALTCLAPALASAQEQARAWDDETLELFASLPVQDGGRVKPLDTVAGFTLLRLNGRRSCKTPEGQARTSLSWLLDCLFYPQAATRYEVFLIQSSDVLDSIGVAHEQKGRRDRYSYADLLPGRESLLELARGYAAKERKERGPLENQIVDLATKVLDFEELTHYLDFARRPFSVRGSQRLARIVLDADHTPLSELLTLSAFLGRTPGELSAAGPGNEDEIAFIEDLQEEIHSRGGQASALAFFPPPESAADEAEWSTPADLVGRAFSDGRRSAEELKLLRTLEKLEAAKADAVAFRAELQQLHAEVVRMANRRGEYESIGLEVFYYRGDFFFWAQLLFGLGFLLVAISWLKPDSKLLGRAVVACLVLGTAPLILGIVLRCFIRGRPPVTTLYETILFVTVVAVVVSLLMEAVNRQRVALALAAVLGVAGMFLASKYELREAASANDTMPSMMAVLDTNFWLATHVTTITMGYAAGLLASALAHVWLVGKMLGLKRGEPAFYESIEKMTYGALCFALVFCVVGTILGGIWANYSWGRFWGWDPKENGALLIVLWQLAILHARAGRLIKAFGFAVTTVLGGLVVIFSWWGVNLLGVGLHSYGFTSGVFTILVGVFAVEGLLLIGAAGWRWRQRHPAPAGGGDGGGSGLAQS